MEAQVQREEEYQDTPEDWAARLTMEFSAARKEVEKWHAQGKKIIARFRDDRTNDTEEGVRWNLYTSNVQTQRAMMYGRIPTVEVSRKFADANDDDARVAAEMLERLLNCDITRETDGYRDGLAYALDDLLMPGMGICRLRYVVEIETFTAEPILHPETGEELEPAEEQERKVAGTEDVEVDYVQWNDVLWSAGARTFSEVRWFAFRTQMTLKQVIKRFGEEIGRDVPLNSKKPSLTDEQEKVKDPRARADVWEVWSKEAGKVVWYVEGYAKALDVKDDTLELEGFWPFPKPMFANRTNNTLVPRPDFYLAQDLYLEVDEISARISLIVKALRVAGVYDKTAGDIGRLVNETRQNELIPVDNWAMFAEKGGIKGQLELLPILEIAQTLDKLRDYRQEVISALYQITGFSDIMRGQSSVEGVTATEQGIKARFASVRMQALQDEFARFASDVQRLKAEIICKHFDDGTIIERSNVQFTPDAMYAQRAVQLLKSRFAHYRVEVKPEAVSLTDFAALKQERTEFMMALSNYFTAMAPIVQAMPGSMTYLLEMLKWFVAGMRGGSSIEAVLDRAIADAQKMVQMQQQNPQQQAPDPKLQAAQLKAQSDQMKMMGDMQKEKAKLQADLTRIQAETVAKDQQERSQAMWNTFEAAKKHEIARAAGATATPGVLGGAAM